MVKIYSHSFSFPHVSVVQSLSKLKRDGHWSYPGESEKCPHTFRLLYLKSFFLLLCLLCIPLQAKAGEYVISSGDTISILVWGHSEYTQTIPVRPDGRISYPFLGEIKIDGMTTTELAEKIREELLKHILDPQVTVVVAQPKKNEVFVFGQVRMPNQFRFDRDKISLLKVLSMAGGVLDDTADLHNVKIIKDDGTSEVIDMERLLASEPQQSVFLSSGDTVYIPKKEFIRITGCVVTPGEYKTKSGIGVTQALAMAGGPMQDTADLSNTLILRPTGEIINIKLNGDFGSKDNQNEAYMLYPGDTLYVPNAYKVEEVNVIGYVRNPGKHKVKGPLSLFETLTVAGGIVDTREADLQRACIIRGNGTVESADLSALREPTLKDIGKLNSIQLYPSDTLEIPQKKKPINWSLTLTIVTILSLTFNMLNSILK